MGKNGCPAVNNEKTIFMKCQGNDFIIYCLFVDDMMRVPTCDALKQEFMAEYTKDFQITGGGHGLLETLLDLQVEHANGKIRRKRFTVTSQALQAQVLSNGLTCFAVSDWAMSLSRRSATGNLFNRSPISWRLKLQKPIALSTAGAGYYSASTAAVEVIYLRYLLRSMGFSPKSWTPVLGCL
jgi:hypothetical protein